MRLIPHTTTPHDVLDDFFEWYSLENVRQELSQLIENAMNGSTEVYGQQLKRNELLFLAEKLNKLLEAAYSIRQNTTYAEFEYA